MRAEMRADLPRTPSGHPTVFETDVRPNLPTPWLRARLSLPSRDARHALALALRLGLGLAVSRQITVASAGPRAHLWVWAF